MTGIPPQLVPDDRPADRRNMHVLHNVRFGAVRISNGSIIPTMTLLSCPANGEAPTEHTYIIEGPEAWAELSEAIAHHAGHAFDSGGFARFVDPTMS